jgi:hypothetical protein
MIAVAWRRQRQDAEQERQELYRKVADEALGPRIEDLIGRERTISELIDLGSPPVTGAADPPSKEEMRQEVDGAVRAVQERLERIEERFPQQSTIDKISSVNDAILATKVEQLEKSIENLEARLLTKWDVATIVFAVMAAIGGVAGVIFAVANFVLK